MSIFRKVGEKAPEFALKDQNGKDVRLKDFLGKKNVVLYFYPKDDTPGCTKEACNFKDELWFFNALDAQILGVSVDQVDSHDKFAKKYALNFPILSDSNKSVTQDYGVLNDRGSASRVTYIIDKQGVIRNVFTTVKVDGHSEEVKQALQALSANV